MQVWEERYTNNKGKKESKRTYDIFQIYDNLPLPRDIKELTRQVYFPNQKLQNIAKSAEFQRRYHSIRSLYTNYDFEARATLHDNYKNRQINEALAIKGAEYRLKIFENTVSRITLADSEADRMVRNNTEKVVVGEELLERPKRDKDQSKSLLENQQMRSLAVDDFFKLVNDNVVRTENKNDNTHTITDEGIDYFKDKEEYKDKFNVNDFITED